MLTGKSLKWKDGQLFYILTRGRGNMSPFAAQLDVDRRWDVINYVRRLQQNRPATAPPDPAPQTETPQP